MVIIQNGCMHVATFSRSRTKHKNIMQFLNLFLTNHSCDYILFMIEMCFLSSLHKLKTPFSAKAPIKTKFLTKQLIIIN